MAGDSSRYRFFFPVVSEMGYFSWWSIGGKGYVGPFFAEMSCCLDYGCSMAGFSNDFECFMMFYSGRTSALRCRS